MLKLLYFVLLLIKVEFCIRFHNCHAHIENKIIANLNTIKLKKNTTVKQASRSTYYTISLDEIKAILRINLCNVRDWCGKLFYDQQWMSCGWHGDDDEFCDYFRLLRNLTCMWYELGWFCSEILDTKLSSAPDAKLNTWQISSLPLSDIRTNYILLVQHKLKNCILSNFT